jgi:hypothetical protein
MRRKNTILSTTIVNIVFRFTGRQQSTMIERFARIIKILCSHSAVNGPVKRYKPHGIKIIEPGRKIRK